MNGHWFDGSTKSELEALFMTKDDFSVAMMLGSYRGLVHASEPVGLRGEDSLQCVR